MNWESKDLKRELSSILNPNQVFTDPMELSCYSYDTSFYSAINPHMPQAVVSPKSLQDVVELIKWAGQKQCPIIPRGAATGQAGGTLAISGGIVLDLSSWNEIESIEPQNKMVFCRPGVTYAKLNQALEPHGLYLPPDPSSGDACTIGGMAANNSSGPRSLKHGALSNYVLGLEVVLGTGEVLVTGGVKGKVLKNVSGLNLNSLFLGSEGILGIITGIWLAVAKKPRARAAVVMIFDKAETAQKASQEIESRGVVPAAMEFVYCAPEATRAAASFYEELYVPGAEIEIICEVDGNEESVTWEYTKLQEVAKEYAQASRGSNEPHGIHELWEINDNIEGFSASIREGAKRIAASEDVCVKLEKLPKILREIQLIAKQNGIGIVNFGHWAKGHIHSGLLAKVEDPGEVDAAFRTADEIHRLVLQEGGATTAEHGVGFVRAPYMLEEHENGLDWMVKIKEALDPFHILNPGKICPLETRKESD
ncbi:MAG: hypothetical protein APF84_10845 [Gracilibacter sp. BRH_c7a]|nr:MAG: hypothetical protein APF84_10845 [Gracilibacter sp. BRH_c7a]